MKKIMTRLLSLVLLGAFIPSFVLADNWYLDQGDITVEAKDNTQTVTQGETSKPDLSPVISNSKTPDSSTSTENTLTRKAEEKATANVTLNNVNIKTDNGAAISTSGNVNIELEGTNTVQSGSGHAGVEKDNTGTLTITDKDNDGTLKATGGTNGAGIGGGAGKDGTDITISGGKVTANGGKYGAGIGGGYMGAGTDISISGGKVTATGGEEGAGIGGGDYGAGTGIIVSGGEVNANGGLAGAGIGGGFDGDGTDITVSNDAQVKVQGGKEYRGVNYGTGAGIGDGGTLGQDGAELPQDPDKLNEGTIQYYAPGADMQTGAPTETLYNPNGNHTWDGGTVTTPATCTTPGVKAYTCQTQSAHTKTQEIPALGHQFETYVYNNDATTEADGTETAHCAHPGCTVTDTRTAKGTKLEATTQQDTQVPNQQSLYWVTGPEGQSLTYQAQQKDGVLTVTVQAGNASLHGTTESLRQLEAQGITEIRFVTNKAQSGFALSDLLASGTGNVTLTHDGDKVTFTLESKDISGILK